MYGTGLVHGMVHEHILRWYVDDLGTCLVEAYLGDGGSGIIDVKYRLDRLISDNLM